MKCEFCNQELTPQPAGGKCNLWCRNHNVNVYYYLCNNLIDIEFLALIHYNPLKCIQLNYTLNQTLVYMDSASKPYLTINGLLNNVTPDNFYNKLRTILTFS